MIVQRPLVVVRCTTTIIIIRPRGGADQKQTTQGVKLNYLSGYTQGTIGVGLDVQAMMGLNLDGGISPHTASTANTLSPTTGDGSPVDSWTRLGANFKARFAKSDIKIGNALAPNLPILLTNDGRLLPQGFEGGIVTIRDIPDVTLTAGKITHAVGRASTNYAGLAAAGGTHASNNFQFAGADWAVTKDLKLQYYHANLENYYSQDFVGLLHQFTFGDNQSFKTDLRFFDSRADGKNGEPGYVFNNASGYAADPGEVKNRTWSAAFTYGLGAHSLMLGRQRVSDDGAMPYVNNGSVRGGDNRAEGEGGAWVYLNTDQTISSFIRAGESTNYGQYSYDFAALGVPGLSASLLYLHGDDIIDHNRNGDHYTEWERDMRVDYAIQAGALKGVAFSLRRANYRTDIPGAQGGANDDQTRFYINYTYAFK